MGWLKQVYSMLWYRYVLRKEDKNVIVKALKFEVSGSTGRGRPRVATSWKSPGFVLLKSWIFVDKSWKIFGSFPVIYHNRM